MCKSYISVTLILTAIAAFAAMPPAAEVERVLEGMIIQDDFVNEEEPPYISRRYRDSLRRYDFFIRKHKCTTNEFVEALMLAATNGTYSLQWTEEQKNIIAGRALIALSEMDRPDVTNFVRIVNADEKKHFRRVAFSTPFIHTNLEPEIMEYMKSQCVRTNVYDGCETSVMYDMLETLSTMPPALQPAATNRVAQFFYFAIKNITSSQGVHDLSLIDLIPEYSNSIQRLSLMQYVSATATNKYTRIYAEKAVQLLSAAPTNTLNNIPWIAQ